MIVIYSALSVSVILFLAVLMGSFGEADFPLFSLGMDRDLMSEILVEKPRGKYDVIVGELPDGFFF